MLKKGAVKLGIILALLLVYDLYGYYRREDN
jgi:hypothetical protein